MEFGDVLDRWDRMTGSSGGANFGGGKNAAGVKTVDAMTSWLNKNEIFDKDAAEAADSGQSEAERRDRRRRVLRKKPDDSIDLHGKTRDEAWIALGTFFDNARSEGFDKVLLIHGKGNHSVSGDGILEGLCRQFIEQCSFAGESGHSDGASGGSGSTWVVLKGEPLKTTSF
jgi:DNA-nicking Smr family endonuclease